uniref:ATP synthase complex subunit 8 n=1 Tax=Pseudaesopia japonica TaxID=195642 RepID=X2L5V9_9PLEU|nr:ATP synthase F0 subunit 8 [Pseudaesopia japonica]AHN95308.1 ATP synthase F0 subunit 8 [Pseudaesopia japonica]AID59867.1 ATP synthase F0 subunit 8 [Pseudaesopia japonica]
MPQLNPAPWFFTMVFSWVVLLSLLPSKFLSLLFPNELTQPIQKKTNTTFSNWLWP